MGVTMDQRDLGTLAVMATRYALTRENHTAREACCGLMAKLMPELSDPDLATIRDDIGRELELMDGHGDYHAIAGQWRKTLRAIVVEMAGRAAAAERCSQLAREYEEARGRVRAHRTGGLGE